MVSFYQVERTWISFVYVVRNEKGYCNGVLFVLSLHYLNAFSTAGLWRHRVCFAYKLLPSKLNLLVSPLCMILPYNDFNNAFSPCLALYQSSNCPCLRAWVFLSRFFPLAFTANMLSTVFCRLQMGRHSLPLLYSKNTVNLALCLPDIFPSIRLLNLANDSSRLQVSKSL